MAKILLRRQVLELRKLGKSYSQIRKELGVSKSTLSGWLKNYPLPQEQLRRLQYTDLKIEKYRETMRLKREARWKKYYDEAKLTILPLTKRELFLAGLFLYWGEGGKTNRCQISISNADPAVLEFSLCWIQIALNIPKEKITVRLHLYEDMDIETEIDFWHKTLNIPKRQFAKPYIKKSKKTDLDEKGYGHGTCNLVVSNTEIKEKILMSLKAISDYSKQYISTF